MRRPCPGAQALQPRWAPGAPAPLRGASRIAGPTASLQRRSPQIGAQRRRLGAQWAWQAARRRARPAAAAAAVAAPAAASPAAVLLSVGVFLVGLALAVLAVAAVPLLLEMRRTAAELQRLTRALEREVPDTAATVRLTGMELSDAISEVSQLSGDVTRGIQASARMVLEAEGTVKQGAAFVRQTAAGRVLPAIRARVPQAQGVLEELLRANAELRHTQPALLQVATVTKVTARRLRLALAAADVARRARAVTAFLGSRAAPGPGPGYS